jgi:hypothetical protein
MKQTFTKAVRVPKMCLVLLLSVFSITSFAHNVRYFDPPCFTQGSTVTIPVWIANAGSGSAYHWQYRIPGGAWTWLSNGNNTINGRTFLVSNGYIAGGTSTSNNSSSTGAYLTPQLSIANVGSPAYTTQLDNIELRVIMTDGLDPQTNPYPGTSAWGAEEFANPSEAKYIRIISKPATEQCYTNCTGNIAVVNPLSPTLATYWGGFEMGSIWGGTASENFSTPGTNGVTTKAATDLTLWTSGTFSNSNYRIINNPDSVSSTFNAIAPHSGRQMMIARTNSATSRIWQRTITTSGTNVYSGQVTFKAWFSRIEGSATAPCMTMEVKGATTASGTVAAITGGSANATISGTSGNWVQISVTVTLTPNTYRKLEFSIHSCNSTSVYVALDDICLLEPSSGPLPVVLTGLKGAYNKGVANLTWGTQQEQNSSHFEVERSNDGVSFSLLGKIVAAGNSSKELSYKFDDVKANAGSNYYRLKMVDKDGRYEYSNTVLLNVSIKGFNITGIYPSPFADRVNISISSENASTGSVRLMDNTGKVVAQQNIQIKKGITSITLDNLGRLAKGFYIAEVTSGETVVTQKIMK